MSKETSAPAGEGRKVPESKMYPLESISISTVNATSDNAKIPSEQPNSGMKGHDPAEVKKELFWLSQTAAQTGTTWLHSFLGLGLLDLYQYQHELAEIGEALYDEQKYAVDDIEHKLSDSMRQRLRKTLREYYQAVQTFRSILQIPELELDLWQEAGDDVSARVGNRVGYGGGPWLDLRHPTPRVDKIRSFLQKRLPVKLVLDNNDNLMGNYLEYAKADPGRTPGDDSWHSLAMKYGRGPLVSRGRTQGRQESSRINVLGRLIVALIGGLFFLVPLIIMTFVKSHNDRLIVVSAAVFLFSTAVAVLSESSNQELIAATAAYAAVLVVYVGTAS